MQLIERCSGSNRSKNASLSQGELSCQAQFLKKVAASPKCPKSACPSPEKYMESYQTQAENVFVFTLSGKLSAAIFARAFLIPIAWPSWMISPLSAPITGLMLEMVLAKIKVKDVLVMDTRGVSSMYANDGGVIVTL